MLALVLYFSMQGKIYRILENVWINPKFRQNIIPKNVSKFENMYETLDFKLIEWPDSNNESF